MLMNRLDPSLEQAGGRFDLRQIGERWGCACPWRCLQVVEFFRRRVEGIDPVDLVRDGCPRPDEDGVFQSRSVARQHRGKLFGSCRPGRDGGPPLKHRSEPVSRSDAVEAFAARRPSGNRRAVSGLILRPLGSRGTDGCNLRYGQHPRRNPFAGRGESMSSDDHEECRAPALPGSAKSTAKSSAHDAANEAVLRPPRTAMDQAQGSWRRVRPPP